jgi:hypothetical protein
MPLISNYHTITMSAVSVSAPKFNKPAHRGECGVVANKIHMPFFLLGCCGDARSVVKIQTLNVPAKIDKTFFAKIAALLQMEPFNMFDWDWNSFRRNILAPNEQHIAEVMGLDEFFTKRVMSDLYVVLNNWTLDADEEDIAMAKEEGLNLLSHETFFTEKHVEY